MKRFSMLLLITAFLFSMIGIAGASSHTFKPPDDGNDLYDLDHHKYYTWGINWTIPSGETISAASLFFDDIRNWDTNDNDLWVHLLDSAPSGSHELGDDNQNSADYFASTYTGTHFFLNHWEDLGTTAQDITYDFDSSELYALIDYVSDKNFGLGFDPDCHYWNNGITLTIETAPVPEPATMLLLGSGLIGLAGFRRKIEK